MEKILSFEEFQAENQIVESVYRTFETEINENTIDIFESDDLTSGEKAAIARDFQILTIPQLAAIYLRAKGKDEDDPNKFMNLIQSTEGNILDFADENKWSDAALADAIGLNSVFTVSRTASKFKNMINGVGHTESDTLYPKIIKAFEEFKKMNLNEIGSLAGEALQKSDNTLVRDKVQAQSALNSVRRQGRKDEMEMIGRLTYQLASKLEQAFSSKTPLQVLNMAIDKIAKEKNMQPIKVQTAYDKYVKSYDL